MASNQPILSHELMTLKEKIGLKKLDREVYIHQTQAILHSKKEERNALRVGNACLTHMTSKQLMMPMTLNAACFAHNKKDKLNMQRLPLHISIGVNDSRLFKCGKRLLKQDYISRCSEESLQRSKRQLMQSKIEANSVKAEYEQSYKGFLHTQVMVDDSRDRENAAKLTHRRLQKILDELKKDLVNIPLRIKRKERLITEKTMELQDFTLLKERAFRYLEVEKEALKPVNLEMASVTHHFDNIIVNTRKELDDRKKSVALARFLADREANPLSFGETVKVLEIQFKKRNKSIAAYDMITALKDAAMVSDIDQVVDCFRDQEDLMTMLGEEKTVYEERNVQLKEKLEFLGQTNSYLKHDATKMSRISRTYRMTVAEEFRHSREIEQTFLKQKKQDRLMSTLQLIVNALEEKLRPIKLEEAVNVEARALLLLDIKLVAKKLDKMIHIIKNNDVPIGPVKPIMLELYKEERVPADSIRLDLTPTGGLTPSMTSFEKFVADSPGLVTREMLKGRAAECQAENEKRRKVKKK